MISYLINNLIIGWIYGNAIQSGGALSDILLSIDLPVVSDADCNAVYAGEYILNPVYPSMMCAGVMSGKYKLEHVFGFYARKC